MKQAAEPYRRRSRVSIPTHAHPAAKIVFAEMQRQGITYDELEHRSGVLRSTLKAWRTNNRPSLETLEATLGALGWAILPVPPYEALAPEVRAKIEALAAEHRLDEDAVLSALVREIAERPLSTDRGRPLLRAQRQAA